MKREQAYQDADKDKGFPPHGRGGNGGTGGNGSHGNRGHQGTEEQELDWDRSATRRLAYGDYGNQRGNRGEGSPRHDAARSHWDEQAGGHAQQQGGQAWHSRDGHAGGQRRGPKGYIRSDERIREDICERVIADPWLDAGDVSIEVKDGMVTLEGSVAVRTMRFALESIAESCTGVKDIDNRVRVARPGPAKEPANSGPGTGSNPKAGLENGSVSGAEGLGGQNGGMGGDVDASRFIRRQTD